MTSRLEHALTLDVAGVCFVLDQLVAQLAGDGHVLRLILAARLRHQLQLPDLLLPDVNLHLQLAHLPNAPSHVTNSYNSAFINTSFGTVLDV